MNNFFKGLLIGAITAWLLWLRRNGVKRSLSSPPASEMLPPSQASQSSSTNPTAASVSQQTIETEVTPIQQEPLTAPEAVGKVEEPQVTESTSEQVEEALLEVPPGSTDIPETTINTISVAQSTTTTTDSQGETAEDNEPTQKLEPVDPRSHPLMEIVGMTPEFEEQFVALGIGDTLQLLNQTLVVNERRALAQKLHTNPRTIKEFANRADLLRLGGITGEWANLLEEAGVNSCKELQHRKAENLYKTLTHVQETRQLVKEMPTLEQISIWIAEAKGLSLSGLQEEE